MADWRPATDRATLQARARLMGLIREYFSAREVLEVETAALSTAGNSDPGIQQFALDGNPALQLRTSPEYPMKRLLAAGCSDIYEMGRVFRDGESGKLHNPEFTLLEWYRLGWNYTELMAETAALVGHCGKAFGRKWPVQSKCYREVFSDLAGVDPFSAESGELSVCASGHGLNVSGSTGLDRDGWLDLLLSHVIQQNLPRDTITMIFDFPASQSALARIRPDEPPVAERFELFLGGIELANGYQELTDAMEQRARFENENRKRVASGLDPAVLDEHLLAALAHGLPQCAGVALGVDRLLMTCLGHPSIEQVLAFPADRA